MKNQRFGFKMIVLARNNETYEVQASMTAKSERTARLQVLLDALAVNQRVTSIELCKRRAGK